MQLPNIDRTAIRPAGTEVVAPAPRVIPVAPVNPPVPEQPSPGVVNDINPVVQAQAQEAAAKADPQQSSKDWTQRQETAPKQEEAPPKEPLSRILMDHMTAVWSASARVVEIWMQNNPAHNPVVNQQVQTQIQSTGRQVDPVATPGVVAKEVLTYSPTQIRKTEKPE